MDDITKAETLENAAGLLKTEGWGRGELEDYEGKRCAIGSIAAALDIEMGYHSSAVYMDSRVIEMATTLKAHGVPERVTWAVDPVGDVVQWNDHDVPDADAVVDLFMTTAKDLRNRGGVDV